jgi:hypothetical protein
MRTGLLALAVSAALFLPYAAQAKPPQITWDWYNAAETYRNYGKKGPDDLKIAAHYYLLAAQRGNASAAYKLGDMFENGIGVGKSYANALKWYRTAADLGDKYGQYRVGWFYQQGLGVSKNSQEAVKWYTLSAKQDNEWAYHSLAFMLADGEGLPKNTDLARQYFELSLPRTNDAWAKWKLAMIVAKQDPKRARALLQQSASTGNPEAQKALRIMGK